MKRSPILRAVRPVLLVTAALLVASLLAPSAADAQDYYRINYSNPCPHFSIQDIFDDPKGDWDRDQVNNATELYNGLKPCVKDSAAFCASQPSLCLPAPTTTHNCSNGYWTWGAVNSDPYGDWDSDGVANRTEARNGANPCDHPCPNWSSIDVALNPNGSWDNDGISNAVEVWQGTNPCDGYYYNPCPHWNAYNVSAMPNHDWDGDGVTNSVEVKRGTNPCHRDSYVIIHPAPTPKPLPHVNTPPPGYKCPAGYPYYHAPTNLCYINPVRGY